MSNETWPDGSPRDPRFRPSKTGIGWIFDGPEGAVGPFDLEGARNYERFILALTIIEQHDADPKEQDLLGDYDHAIEKHANALTQAQDAEHDLKLARQRWERDADPYGPPELLRDYDDAIEKHANALTQAQDAEHDLKLARQRWERRHYIDRDRSVDGCPKAPQAPKEPNGS